MTRTNAREIAAHLLYAMEYTGQPADRTLEVRLEPDYYRGLAQESEAYAERSMSACIWKKSPTASPSTRPSS